VNLTSFVRAHYKIVEINIKKYSPFLKKGFEKKKEKKMSSKR